MLGKLVWWVDGLEGCWENWLLVGWYAGEFDGELLGGAGDGSAKHIHTHLN